MSPRSREVVARALLAAAAEFDGATRQIPNAFGVPALLLASLSRKGAARDAIDAMRDAYARKDLLVGGGDLKLLGALAALVGRSKASEILEDAISTISEPDAPLAVYLHRAATA